MVLYSYLHHVSSLLVSEIETETRYHFSYVMYENRYRVSVFVVLVLSFYSGFQHKTSAHLFRYSIKLIYMFSVSIYRWVRDPHKKYVCL